MKIQHPPNHQSGIVSLRVLAVVVLLCGFTLLLYAADPGSIDPAWWTTQNVVQTGTGSVNNYAAANQGQVKNMAAGAVAEFDLDLPGGAGQPLHLLISGWVSGSASANNYAAINLGQLKMVAQPFYDRLISLGYATQYPWTGAANPNDYAVANIGQVKNLFSFDPAHFPQITDPPIQTVYVGSSFNGSITATNTPTGFNATGLPQGLSIDTTTGTISGSVLSSGTGLYNVTLSAFNSSGTSTDVVVFDVLAPSGAAPVITSDTYAIATVGSAFAYQITGSFNPASFSATGTGGGSLPQGLSVDAVGGLISGTVETSGTYGMLLGAYNGAGSGIAHLTLAVTDIPVGGGPPPAVTTGTVSGTVGQSFSYNIVASYSPTSYTAGAFPAGLSLNTSTGLISGNVDGTPGVYFTVIGASNANGTSTQPLKIVISGSTPQITSPLIANGMCGLEFVYAIKANNNPVGFGCGALPAGLHFDPVAGAISGSISNAATTGTFPVVVSATDANGNVASGTLNIVISAAQPVITSATSSTAMVGVLYAFPVDAANGPATYSASNLPPGLELNPNTGDIMGIPTTPGVYSGSLYAVASGQTSSGTGASPFVLTVANVNKGPAIPTITSPWIMYGVNGQPFSGTVTAAFSPTGFEATGLPSGLSINQTSGVISGSPSGVGTYVVTLTASNSVDTATSQMIYVVESATSTVPATVQLQAGISPTSSYQSTFRHDFE